MTTLIRVSLYTQKNTWM